MSARESCAAARFLSAVSALHQHDTNRMKATLQVRSQKEQLQVEVNKPVWPLKAIKSTCRIGETAFAASARLAGS